MRRAPQVEGHSYPELNAMSVLDRDRAGYGAQCSGLTELQEVRRPRPVWSSCVSSDDRFLGTDDCVRWCGLLVRCTLAPERFEEEEEEGDVGDSVGAATGLKWATAGFERPTLRPRVVTVGSGVVDLAVVLTALLTRPTWAALAGTMKSRCTTAG